MKITKNQMKKGVTALLSSMGVTLSEEEDVTPTPVVTEPVVTEPVITEPVQVNTNLSEQVQSLSTQLSEQSAKIIELEAKLSAKDEVITELASATGTEQKVINAPVESNIPAKETTRSERLINALSRD